MQNVHIITYGCSNNQAESEIMAGLLARAGFSVVQRIENADAIVVNTCIVKEPTEKRVVDDIKQIQKRFPAKKLIIAGCMPEAEYGLAKRIAPNASLISTHNVTKIADVMKKTLEGKRTEILDAVGKIQCEKILHPRIRKNKIIDIVPICSGCSSMCSYCITKIAKGELISYSPKRIVKEIELAKKEGCKEFWLTAQDCGCYGQDILTEQNENKIKNPQDFTNCNNTNLAKLIKSILENLKGKYKIRIGMLNPRHVKNFYKELIAAYDDERVFKFLHLPVQSGSDKILAAMNRGYIKKDFIEIVDAFRKGFPEIQIWTDVIVGFPGETENDFQETVDLIKSTKPDFVNVSKFGARPGTAAERLKPIDNKIIKHRSEIISELVRKISTEQNKKWLNWKGEILIDEYNHTKKSWIGRNFAYKPIIITEHSEDISKKTNRPQRGEDKLNLHLGDFVDIKIIDVEKNLIGEVIS